MVTVDYLVVALLIAIHLLLQGGIELSATVWKVGLV